MHDAACFCLQCAVFPFAKIWGNKNFVTATSAHGFFLAKRCFGQNDELFKTLKYGRKRGSHKTGIEEKNCDCMEKKTKRSDKIIVKIV